METNTQRLIASLNAQIEACGLLPLNAEQVELLTNSPESEDCKGMLEDLRDRCGLDVGSVLPS